MRHAKASDSPEALKLSATCSDIFKRDTELGITAALCAFHTLQLAQEENLHVHRMLVWHQLTCQYASIPLLKGP